MLLAALSFSACDSLTITGEEATISPDPTATSGAVLLTPIAPDVPLVSPTGTPTQASETIRVWIPPEIASKTDEGLTTLSNQFSAYDSEHPEITLVVEQKRAVGSGSVLSYLRTGRDVAPTILPDLIAIPADLLPTMTAENLIYPLNGRIDDASIETLFPSALSLAQIDADLMGYPFVATILPHLAYNNNALPGILPLTWERLVDNAEHEYTFAADGLDGALLALQFYLDAGGNLVNGAGQPVLETEPLVEALQYIEDGQDSGLFTAQSGSLNSTEQAWQSFLGGGGNIVQTTSDLFLGQRISGLPIAYTVIPGIDRPLTPLAGGWIWAITTAEQEKQNHVAGIIQALTSAEALAAWSYESEMLPARRDAYDAWPVEEPYLGFVRQELERAAPLAVPTSGKLITVLGDAVYQIVSEGSSAQQAAANAVNAMNE